MHEHVCCSAIVSFAVDNNVEMRHDNLHLPVRLLTSKPYLVRRSETVALFTYERNCSASSLALMNSGSHTLGQSEDIRSTKFRRSALLVFIVGERARERATIPMSADPSVKNDAVCEIFSPRTNLGFAFS